MERLQTLAMLAVAVAVLFVTVGAGTHAAQLAYDSSLPVLKLERVVVVAPAASTQVADATPESN
jgi:hypothetical protein